MCTLWRWVYVSFPGESCPMGERAPFVPVGLAGGGAPLATACVAQPCINTARHCRVRLREEAAEKILLGAPLAPLKV